MSQSSPLLIISFKHDEVHALTELARTLGYPDAHVVEGGFREAVDALKLRTSPPDYVIVDIDERGHDVLRELDEFAMHCEPTVRVVIIGSINDILFYRELKSRGVLEYFTRPVTAGDIRPVLLQGPVQNYRPGTTSSQGKVISFMSAASGDGASTLALNFAYSLAKDCGQSVVLVDMDYQFGLIAKSLDLAAPFGIRELFDHPDRGLDQMLITKMLVKYKDGLSIIAAPSELRTLPTIRPEVIRELIAVLRQQFAFVVIDVPHVWTEWTAGALTYSDHVVMVAQLWLRSLTHASRLLGAWHNIGVERDDVSLIINRSGAKFKEAITSQDFERICRHKIETYVSNDVKSITQAETHAKTLFEVGNGALQQQVRDMAKAAVARYQGQGMQVQSEGGQGLTSKKGLLALLDKRKP